MAMRPTRGPAVRRVFFASLLSWAFLVPLSAEERVENETNATVYRIAIVRDLITPPCAFSTLLPSPDCRPLNFYLNISVLFGQIAFGSTARFAVVPARNWSFESRVPMDPWDRSVMGLVEKGEADLTPPDMSLSLERIGRARFVRILANEELCLSHKRTEQRRNELSVERLAWEPRGVWILLGGCLALRAALAHAARLLRNHSSMEVFVSFRERSSVFLFLVFGVCLSLMGKHLYSVFTDVSGYEATFLQRPGQLTRALRDHSYAIVINSLFWLEELRINFAGPVEELEAALGLNPPSVETNSSVLRRVMLSDVEGSYPHHLLVSTRKFARLLGLEGCEFSIECSPYSAWELPVTAFFSPNVTLPVLDSSHVGRLSREAERASHAYYPPSRAEAPCSVGLPEEPLARLRLALPQIAGLLQMTGALALSALVLLALEQGWRRCRLGELCFRSKAFRKAFRPSKA